jgi:hypothetical protein
MAVQTDVSSPANGTAAIFTLITELCASGWLVKAWSDATTYTGGVSLSANPYGSASSGAGNLGNTSAWFRIAAPDGSREWLFFRGSADQTWTISRSKAGFTGGTPNATTAGTATDATALFSAAQAFPTTTWRMFISCDGASPYGFTCYGITLGGGNVLHFLIDEPLLSGTTDTSDTDPYLWWGYYNATGLAASTSAIATISGTLLYKRFTGAGSNQVCAMCRMTTQGQSGTTYAAAPPTDASSQVGMTPSSLVEVPLRIPVVRLGASSSTTGWVGLTSRLRWATVHGRLNGQTLAQGASAYWIFMAGVWVPWDSSTPALS